MPSMKLLQSPARTLRFATSLSLIFATAHSVASAQCSQAFRPAMAPLGESNLQNDPGKTAGEASSSQSQSVPLVRFAPDRPLTVPEETAVQVINDLPISSRTARPGAKLTFTVTRDVIVDRVLVIPCGATVFGTVVQAKQAGRLVGASSLTLQMTTLNLDGRSYPLYTPPFKVTAASKTVSTLKKVSVGAAAGALAEDVLGPVTVGPHQPPRLEHPPISAGQRAADDAVVAGLGAGIGAAVAASSPPSVAVLPSESEIEFTLASPIAIFPVDQTTAVRLAQGLHHNGPVLSVRSESQ